MNAIHLTPADTEAVLRRFYRCFDGLIRKVEIDFSPDSDHSTASVIVSARDDDARADQDDGWVNVIWKLSGLTEFAISEGRVSHQVLSNGLTIGWFNGLVFLDFAGYKPTSIDEFRQSGCYFAGRSCAWEVATYAE